jgi:hypothetical protein
MNLEKNIVIGFDAAWLYGRKNVLGLAGLIFVVVAHDGTPSNLTGLR